MSGVTIFFRPSAQSLAFATHAVSDSSGYNEDPAVSVGDIAIGVDGAHDIVGGPMTLTAKDGQKLTVNLTVASAI